MCEGMLGGMCAGVVCEDILFCTMSVLRSSNSSVVVICESAMREWSSEG